MVQLNYTHQPWYVKNNLSIKASRPIFRCFNDIEENIENCLIKISQSMLILCVVSVGGQSERCDSVLVWKARLYDFIGCDTVTLRLIFSVALDYIDLDYFDFVEQVLGEGQRGVEGFHMRILRAPNLCGY